MTCTAGAVCAPLILAKPTSTRQATSRTIAGARGADQRGLEVGGGIPGSAHSHLSLAMESSTVLLAGAFTRRFTSTVRRASAMDTHGTLITSAPTTTIGALALTIQAIPAMRLGCTMCQTPQLIISVLFPQRGSVVWASTPAHAAS